MDNHVAISLGNDEALTLFDFISEWIRDGFGDKTTGLKLENDGQWHALSGLIAALEKELVQPFESDYVDLVASARERLIEKCGQIDPTN